MSSAKDPKRKTLAKELEDEENTLKQCIEKLKSVEATRAALVSQLKEALHEQVLSHHLLNSTSRIMFIQSYRGLLFRIFSGVPARESAYPDAGTNYCPSTSSSF